MEPKSESKNKATHIYQVIINRDATEIQWKSKSSQQMVLVQLDTYMPRTKEFLPSPCTIYKNHLVM